MSMTPFMIMKPANLIFLLMVLLGPTISLSATSWFLIWFGLEMNLIGLIPLIISKSNIGSSEAAMKYFFMQSVASSLLIISALQMEMNFSLSSLTLLALMAKVGAAPLHFWVPTLLENVNWLSTFLILTWQKLTPLLLITLTMTKMNLLFYIVMSLSFGALSGFNQTSTKKILGFSSISHLAWLLVALKLNLKIFLIYFLVYAATLAILSNLMNNYSINSINKTILMNKGSSLPLYLLMLSLGGMPPMIGFFPKILVLTLLISQTSYLLILLMILGAMINLYFYLRLTYAMLTMFNQSPLKMQKSQNWLQVIFLMLGPLVTLVS